MKSTLKSVDCLDVNTNEVEFRLYQLLLPERWAALVCYESRIVGYGSAPSRAEAVELAGQRAQARLQPASSP